MGLTEDFQAAATKVKTLAGSPSNDELLQLYALFKQAEVGDNNTSRPGLLDMKGKAKWDAWDGKKGTSSDSAKEQYIALANTLVEKYGVK